LQSEVDDSLGYDILSYEKDGTPRYIEAKTTEQKIIMLNLAFLFRKMNWKKQRL